MLGLMDCRRSRPLLAGAVALLFTVAAAGQSPARGIAGRAAPSWGVTQWINLPEGAVTLDVDDFKGKVLYVLGFQSWCPGCHSQGLPTLQRLIGEYRDADDVAFVAVQTVFEGYSTNTPGRAWDTAREYALEIPVGHDGSDGRRSSIMQRYRTGGTPWVIIIDKQGRVRYNDFHIGLAKAHTMIDALRGPSPASEPRARKIDLLPEQRGGQDLVGTPFPKPDFDRVIRPKADLANPARKKAVLYRWWTNGCPYCRASLPAVEQLRRVYGPKGLKVIAVYHPKPPRRVDNEHVLATAGRLGYDGAIVLDEDWSILDTFYLSTGDREATSASFLVDTDNVIRFVHPGPVFFPSDDPDFHRENDDYRALERAIRVLLQVEHEPDPRSKARTDQ